MSDKRNDAWLGRLLRPAEGEGRTVETFCLWPKKIDGRWHWLRTVESEEIYTKAFGWRSVYSLLILGRDGRIREAFSISDCRRMLDIDYGGVPASDELKRVITDCEKKLRRDRGRSDILREAVRTSTFTLSELTAAFLPPPPPPKKETRADEIAAAMRTLATAGTVTVAAFENAFATATKQPPPPPSREKSWLERRMIRNLLSKEDERYIHGDGSTAATSPGTPPRQRPGHVPWTKYECDGTLPENPVEVPMPAMKPAKMEPKCCCMCPRCGKRKP